MCPSEGKRLPGQKAAQLVEKVKRRLARRKEGLMQYECVGHRVGEQFPRIYKGAGWTMQQAQKVRKECCTARKGEVKGTWHAGRASLTERLRFLSSAQGGTQGSGGRLTAPQPWPTCQGTWQAPPPSEPRGLLCRRCQPSPLRCGGPANTNFCQS